MNILLKNRLCTENWALTLLISYKKSLRTVWTDINSIENSVDLDQDPHCFPKMTLWVQNKQLKMKYRIALSLFILVPGGQVNRNS